jgi:DNA primase
MEIYNNLVEYCRAIGISLRRRGNVYQAICPFHNETQASFTVYLDTNRFHCFGCRASGNATRLAELLNKPVPIILSERKGRPMRKYLDPSKSQINLMTNFCKTYSENLPSNVKDYLNGRGFDDDEIERFGFGYCGWKSFELSLPEAKLATLLGLINRNGFINFWGYVLVPEIRNEKVVWFQGRNFQSMTGPKYLNLKLSTPLFGYESIIGSRYTWITEGALDALALIAEDEPAVALIGTSLPQRYRDMFFGRIVKLCLDNDDVGKEATRRIKNQLKGISMITVDVKLPYRYKDLAEMKEKGVLKTWLRKE